MVIIGLETPIVHVPNPDFYNKMRTEETKFTDPGWVEVYDKLAILGKYFEKNALGVGYGQAPGLFAQGKAAMMIDGSWSATQIEDAKPAFEVGAFLLPSSENKDYNSVAPTKVGMGYFVYPSNEERQDAAFKYLAFFSEKDNYQKFTDTVKMFPVISGIKMTSPLAQTISDLTSKQIQLYEEQLIPGAKYDYTNYALQLLTGQLTPEKATQKMQDDLIGSKANWK
jgi:raffinose/stachyose/melibiose transport system substrate-binding protein